MKPTLAALALTALLAPALSQAADAPISAQQYASVLAGSWRDPANSARDGYRHPQQTLEFFGLGAKQSVIEITPGGGWYSEVLAPLLKDQGHSNRLVIALSVRVTFAVITLALISWGFYSGQLVSSVPW